MEDENVKKVMIDYNKEMFTDLGRPELRIIKYKTLYKDDLYKYVFVYDKSADSKINYYDFDENEISKFKILFICSTLKELIKIVNKNDFTYSLEEIEKGIYVNLAFL